MGNTLLDRSQVVRRLARFGFGAAFTSSVNDLQPVSDDQYEAGLRRYQRFHGLQVTGELDSETEGSLLSPRFCGHPDIMDLTSEAQAPPRWLTNKLPWAFVNLDGWRVSRDLVVSCFEWAWATWAGSCNIKPMMVQDPSQALIRVNAARIDGTNGVLAQSELANNTNNPKQQWYDFEAWAEWFLKITALHEIGHVLGIPHLSAGNIMQPTLAQNLRSLQSGDILECVTRYGRPEAPSDPTPTDPTPAGSVILTLEVPKIIALSIPGYRVTKLAG